MILALAEVTEVYGYNGGQPEPQKQNRSYPQNEHRPSGSKRVARFTPSLLVLRCNGLGWHRTLRAH